MARDKDKRPLLIGPLVFDVIVVEGLCDDDHIPIFGIIKHDTCTIEIDAALCEGAAYVTLWEEILHGILVCAGISKHNERHVSALAHGVAQVLKDNPDLWTVDDGSD